MAVLELAQRARESGTRIHIKYYITIYFILLCDVCAEREKDTVLLLLLYLHYMARREADYMRRGAYSRGR